MADRDRTQPFRNGDSRIFSALDSRDPIRDGSVVDVGTRTIAAGWDAIIEAFSFFNDWMERYERLIHLGRGPPPARRFDIGPDID